MSGTKVDSICKKYDGTDALAHLYGTFQEQIATALVPGPRDVSTQCLIKRNKKTSMFYLYLALTPSLTDEGKFLLAARSFGTSAYTEYIISLDADDFSQGSNAYVGKLRSNFLRSNYKVYDSQPPHNGAKPTNGKASRIFASKQISPQVPAGNFEVGQVTYKLNLLGARGPRRMISTLQYPSTDTKPCDVMKKPNKDDDGSSYKILKNKAPRWHEKLQCWCLNFRGRVTTASVKNFQLLATVEESQPSEETMLLQFGKVGDDIFTMDYRHPLSVFQAFAICLTSFGNKLICE